MTNGADILDFNSARSQGEPRRPDFNADEVRDRIAGRAFEFVEWLFPCAVTDRQRRKAFVGDINGSPGESLQIELTGPKAGYWRDWAHAGDEGKDLIGLYMASLNYDRTRDFPRAVKEIATEFLGESAAPKWTRPVTQRLVERAKEHEGKPRPNISERPAPSATYVYHDIDGGIVGLVHRHEFEETGEDGKPRKTFSVWDAKASKAQAPTPRPLYRAPQIARANHVVFVEGEKKADALAAIGIEATCIMFGSNAPLDKVDWSVIGGKLVTFWPDNDVSGRAFCERVIPILSSLGCRVARVQIPSDAPAKWDAADCLAEGGDAAALVNAAIPVDKAEIKAKSRIRLLSLDDMQNLPPVSWLINDTITLGGMSMIWGRSGSLKSFAALDMGMCIATPGALWHGKEVKHGPVVYLAAEGASGLARRAIGWRESRGCGQASQFKIIPHSVTMTSEDRAELIASLKAEEEKPILIVIDTVSRTFGAGNPNQPADMNAYVAAGDELREATGAHVMFIHHAGEDEDRNEVGNKGLRNACDTVIFIKRNRDKIQLINEAPKGKQKDAEEFKTITLYPTKVHFTRNGIEDSTLILNKDETAPAHDEEGEEPARPVRLGRVQQAVMNALRAMGGQGGLTRLLTITEGNKGTLYTTLDSLCERGLLVKTRDENNTRDEWRIA